MSDYYWELITHDQTRIEIPPNAVDVVKRRMSNGQPINTRTEVIPVNQIRHFRITDKRYTPQPLLDAVSQVFKEPQYADDGSVLCKWVKKSVTQSSYNKHYAPLGYKKLGNDGGMVQVAFIVPVHLVDVNSTPYCTREEINKLTK